jgi:lipoprotein-anchoring transpeptidase ErfK/SrfK
VQKTSPDARIWYSASDYPHLVLPDGRSEVVRSVINITRPMRFGDYAWNVDRIPEGPIWVRIDLARQLLSVFRDGHEIGSAVILYGTDGKATPTGSFTILEKDANHYSRSYDAPMPYMLRLTKDGVAIHGSNVREGWATHGCIGVPLDFARLLFGAAKKGDPVIILSTSAKKP